MYHLLVLELLGDIARTASRNFNPGLGEDGTGACNESDINHGVNWVEENSFDSVRRRHVISDTRYRGELRRVFKRL